MNLLSTSPEGQDSSHTLTHTYRGWGQFIFLHQVLCILSVLLVGSLNMDKNSAVFAKLVVNKQIHVR